MPLFCFQNHLLLPIFCMILHSKYTEDFNKLKSRAACFSQPRFSSACLRPAHSASPAWLASRFPAHPSGTFTLILYGDYFRQCRIQRRSCKRSFERCRELAFTGHQIAETSLIRGRKSVSSAKYLPGTVFAQAPFEEQPIMRAALYFYELRQPYYVLYA